MTFYRLWNRRCDNLYTPTPANTMSTNTAVTTPASNYMLYNQQGKALNPANIQHHGLRIFNYLAYKMLLYFYTTMPYSLSLNFCPCLNTLIVFTIFSSKEEKVSNRFELTSNKFFCQENNVSNSRSVLYFTDARIGTKHFPKMSFDVLRRN